jgi:hypothetical protein
VPLDDSLSTHDHDFDSVQYCSRTRSDPHGIRPGAPAPPALLDARILAMSTTASARSAKANASLSTVAPCQPLDGEHRAPLYRRCRSGNLSKSTTGPDVCVGSFSTDLARWPCVRFASVRFLIGVP